MRHRLPVSSLGFPGCPKHWDPLGFPTAVKEDRLVQIATQMQDPALMSQDGACESQIGPDQNRLGNAVEVVMRVPARTPVNVTALVPSRL